jgi:two-component system sensor histidine kinase CpxA
MQSLFLRIFLWFWVAMAVVVALLVASSPFFTRSRPRLEKWHQSAEEVAGRWVEEAARRIEAGALEGHGGRRRGRGPRPPVRVRVFDADGHELEGREASREEREIARRATADGAQRSERSGSVYLVARPVDDPEGRRLVVVGAFRRPPRLVDLLEPRILLPRLAVLVLVAGVFCLLLARHLSSPVASLRVAAARLSEGDLTSRVGPPATRRRDEIGDLARDFDAMADRLEVLVGSQRRLLRDVSHELRSPLARLDVALELARQRAGSAAEQPLERIGRESERLNSLIGRLLELERLASGTPGSDRIPVDLAGMLEEIARDARFEAEARGCGVRLDLSARPRVTAAPELLRSAVENVVRNAVSHTSGGSDVTIVVDRESGPRGGDAVIVVRDCGPGVSEDELGRLFEPFYRVADARDRASGGAGIGLAITERAIHLHGGEIGAANDPDGGLVVTIRLPVSESDQDRASPFESG